MKTNCWLQTLLGGSFPPFYKTVQPVWITLYSEVFLFHYSIPETRAGFPKGERDAQEFDSVRWQDTMRIYLLQVDLVLGQGVLQQLGIIKVQRIEDCNREENLGSYSL